MSSFTLQCYKCQFWLFLGGEHGSYDRICISGDIDHQWENSTNLHTCSVILYCLITVIAIITATIINRGTASRWCYHYLLRIDWIKLWPIEGSKHCLRKDLPLNGATDRFIYLPDEHLSALTYTRWAKTLQFCVLVQHNTCECCIKDMSVTDNNVRKQCGVIAPVFISVCAGHWSSKTAGRFSFPDS